MKICYYPGCTLKTKAKELDIYGRKSLEALGVEFEEIKEWQCCGAVYPVAKDEVATKLSAVRTLALAKEDDGKLLTLCSACHNVIKQTNHAMKNDKEFADKVNRYMGEDGGYNGETEVYHYLEYIRDCIGYDKVKVNIGKLENLDEKLMQLPYILPALAGERGTLDLQNYTLGKKSITFEKE